MFATLDDLEGRSSCSCSRTGGQRRGGRRRPGVVVRGRVDHKEAGKISLVVQEAEPFEPGADELAAARARARRRPSR